MNRSALRFTRIVSVSVLTAACGAPPPSEADTLASAGEPIVGGVLDPDHHYVPWISRPLPNNLMSVCSASLIANFWVLTAAHCLDPQATSPTFDVHFDSGRMATSNQSFPDQDFTFSGRDNQGRPLAPFSHDLMLLQLDNPVDDVTPLRVSSFGPNPVFGQPLTAVGWGLTGPNQQPDFQKRRVQASIVGGDIDHLITTSATCFGDSGGPFLIADGHGGERLYSVTSFGPGGCEGNETSIRTFSTANYEWMGHLLENSLVYGAIRTKYDSMGGIWSILGLPTTEERPTTCGAGRYNFFDEGTIHATATVAPHATTGPILDKWASMGWECSYLGFPTSDVSDTTCPDKQKAPGRYSLFEHGAIHWSPNVGAFATNGAIKAKWAALGWECGYLGFPVNDESNTTCTDKRGARGRFNSFEGGSIHWSPNVGAFATNGGIRNKWASLGWECGYLGFPTNDESDTSCTDKRGARGRYNFFEGGAIHWSPNIGAFATNGAIMSKWASLRWECGFLGFPVNDESDTTCTDKNGARGRFNSFEGGSIHWSPNIGAFSTNGAIRNTWSSMGWECSFLGFPTSEEIPISTGVKQHFEGGTLVWNRSTGAVTVDRGESCSGTVCGTNCCSAGAWCGVNNRCCTSCQPGCPC
jgi:V8-like Glu-specific endopeptidase